MLLLLCGQVLLHYKKEGFDFLLKVFDTPNFLEELTGLDKLHASVEDSQVGVAMIRLWVVMIRWVWVVMIR